MPAPAESPAIGPMDQHQATEAIAALLRTDAAPVKRTIPTREEDIATAENADDEVPTDEADGQPSKETTEATDEPASEDDAPNLIDLPDDAVIAVKVDGKTIRVTGQEMKAGYSRTADYTQKAQVVARERAETAAERQATQQERAQLQAALTKVKEGLDAQAPTQPPLNLYHEDPEEFAYQSEVFRRHQEQVERINKATEELQLRAERDAQRARQDRLREERELLLAKMPEWKDPKREQAESKMIADAASQYGFSAEEMAQIDDHRQINVLRDAARYRDLMARSKDVAAGPAVQGKTRTPTLRPGASSGPETGGVGRAAQAAMQRAASTGKVLDAAAAISRLKL